MNRALIIIIAFVLTLTIHFLWVSHDLEPNSIWADSVQLSEQPQLSGYDLYFKDGEYFLGLSFAIAIAFTVFAISRVKTDKKKGFIGALEGTSLSAGLYAFGCFLVGCCGSPMIVIYAGLFGSSFLGFTKPLIFGVTALSIAFAYWRMTRRPKGKCCSTQS